MQNATHEECCGGATCCCAPSEFSRLRYFYGQRLGAVDFHDEQSYHAGKQKFHNLRAHGVGVLCGLRAERFVPRGEADDAPTTVLRVLRGAALDCCGREIVVGSDHCIDVAAWFAVNRERFDTWVAGSRTLTVAVCYRECPSDPSPAPRDPCGCDVGGCEYARVREGFELLLLDETELERCCDAASFPGPADLRQALGAAGPGSRLESALGALVSAPCPLGDGSTCLCLARLIVTVEQNADGTLRISNIESIENDPPERASVLSTRALQVLLADVARAAAAEGLLGVGPSLGVMEFLGDGSLTGGTFVVPVLLVSENGSTTALVGGTLDPGNVRVQSFDGVAWSDVTPGPSDIQYDPATESIRVGFTAGLVDGASYRVSVVQDFSAPIIDAAMRSVSPGRYAAQVRLVNDGSGSLEATAVNA